MNGAGKHNLGMVNLSPGGKGKGPECQGYLNICQGFSSGPLQLTEHRTPCPLWPKADRCSPYPQWHAQASHQPILNTWTCCHMRKRNPIKVQSTGYELSLPCSLMHSSRLEQDRNVPLCCFHLSPDIWEKWVRKSNRTDWLCLTQRSKTGTQCPDLSHAQPKFVWGASIHGAPNNMAASKVGGFTPFSPWSLLSLAPPLSTFPSPPELPSPLISRFCHILPLWVNLFYLSVPPKNCLA